MDIEQLNEILESIKNPGDDGVPETVYDDITNGFTASADAMGSANARIEQLEAEKGALEMEFNAYKLRMFDKLMNDPGAQSDDGKPDESEATEATTDQLFEDK